LSLSELVTHSDTSLLRESRVDLHNVHLTGFELSLVTAY
jgi:hypothetical protein